MTIVLVFVGSGVRRMRLTFSTLRLTRSSALPTSSLFTLEAVMSPNGVLCSCASALLALRSCTKSGIRDRETPRGWKAEPYSLDVAA